MPLEAVALSNTLMISEPADSTTESDGCLSSMIFNVPTIFYRILKKCTQIITNTYHHH